jgi:hypothetical protein
VKTTDNDVIEDDGSTTLTNRPLRAWTQNSEVHVSGLTIGQPWSLYNLSGVLIYRATATDSQAQIPLPERGLYVVICDNRSVKVMY